MAAALPAKGQDDKPSENGQMSAAEKAEWVESSGWPPRFGPGSVHESEEEDTLLDHQTWVEGILDDKYFGGEE